VVAGINKDPCDVDDGMDGMRVEFEYSECDSRSPRRSFERVLVRAEHLVSGPA
jgi:hypothetical protein